jgi:hypothetical protein
MQTLLKTSPVVLASSTTKDQFPVASRNLRRAFRHRSLGIERNCANVECIASGTCGRQWICNGWVPARICRPLWASF